MMKTNRTWLAALKGILIFGILLQVSCSPSNQQPQREKSSYLWFDAQANYERLSYPDSIDLYLKKASEAGFTDVVVDVKSIMGWTLYHSDYAPYMGQWKGHSRSEDYDMLGIFLDKARKYDLGVHASMNVFSGGHLEYEKGIIYKNHPEWQTMNYTPEGIKPIKKVETTYNGMLNPALPEVQDYEMKIIKEVVKKYPRLEGIVLDRMRYEGITSDFSPASKKMFEQYAGIQVKNYPEDILYWEKDQEGEAQWKRGPHFDKWLEWRASVIHDFAKRVRKEIKSINPDIVYGDYVGAWYPTYYEVGVNWASQDYDPSKDYDWATPQYQKTGYAEYLDLFMGGLYFKQVTVEEVRKMNQEEVEGRNEPGMSQKRADWYSVEGCAELANGVLKDAVPFMGSLYVQQYKGDEKQFKRAVDMAMKKTDGLMIFDAVHLINYNWWDTMEKAIKQNKE